MDFHTIFIIALAVSLDAFGVALSIGLNCKIKRENIIGFTISFAFFQFFCSFVGAYTGYIFNSFAQIPSLVGGIIIAIVGIMMVKEGMEDKAQCILLNPKMYIVLGISVSIDALVVGFITLNAINSIIALLQNTLFIGLVTLVMTSIAFTLSKTLNKLEFISKYADFIGGTILIIFGLKMMFLG